MNDRILYIEFGTVITRARIVEIANPLEVVARSETRTTAGHPIDDLLVAALRAIRELEIGWGGPLVLAEPPLRLHPSSGVKTLVLTSSVFGPSMAAVAGVFKDISAESAQRAVLLAGGLVSDVFAVNDERLPHERRIAFRQRPVDLLVLAGGVDDPSKMPGEQALRVAQSLNKGLPRSRTDPDRWPTVLFAGSAQVRDEIARVFAQTASLRITDNVRPTIEEENLDPARNAILEDFVHTSKNAPRYRKLGVAVTPAGYAAVRGLERMRDRDEDNTLVVDLGGAYVTVCSSIDGVLNRTVSDVRDFYRKRGEAGRRLSEIAAWLPFEPSSAQLSAFVGDRLLRPQVLCEDWEDLAALMASARVEMRLGLEHHQKIAVLLRGVQRGRQIWEIFGYQTVGGQSLVDLSHVKNIILAGGWQNQLSPEQIMLVAIEGLQTVGTNRIYRDPDSLLALAGVLRDGPKTECGSIAEQFDALGTVVAPVGVDARGFLGPLGTATEVVFDEAGGAKRTLRLPNNALLRIPLGRGQTASLLIKPSSGVDYGAGPGKSLAVEACGGDVGVVFDTRNRPLTLPASDQRRRNRLLDWWGDLGAFSEEVVGRWRPTGER